MKKRAIRPKIAVAIKKANEEGNRKSVGIIKWTYVEFQKM